MPDLCFGVGGPIFSLVVGVGFVGDLDKGVVDVAALGGFGGVLAVGCFAVEFAMEVDLEFMNPESVG